MRPVIVCLNSQQQQTHFSSVGLQINLENKISTGAGGYLENYSLSLGWCSSHRSQYFPSRVWTVNSLISPPASSCCRGAVKLSRHLYWQEQCQWPSTSCIIITSTNIQSRKSQCWSILSVLPVICPTAPRSPGCPAGSHSNSCKFVKSSISLLYLSMTGNTLFIFSKMFFLILRSGAKIEQRQSGEWLSLSVLRIGKMRSSFI